MGRQLAFWKYENGIALDAQEVYQKSCIEGAYVPGLAELPFTDILAKAKKTFRDYERIDDYNYGGMEGSFTIRIKPQSVIFDCSLRMSDTELGKIAGLMRGFGCQAYDPQTGVRAEG